MLQFSTLGLSSGRKFGTSERLTLKIPSSFKTRLEKQEKTIKKKHICMQNMYVFCSN